MCCAYIRTENGSGRHTPRAASPGVEYIRNTGTPTNSGYISQPTAESSKSCDHCHVTIVMWPSSWVSFKGKYDTRAEEGGHSWPLDLLIAYFAHSLTDLFLFLALCAMWTTSRRPKRELDLLYYEQNMQLKVTEVNCVLPPLIHECIGQVLREANLLYVIIYGKLPPHVPLPMLFVGSPRRGDSKLGWLILLFVDFCNLIKWSESSGCTGDYVCAPFW